MAETQPMTALTESVIAGIEAVLREASERPWSAIGRAGGDDGRWTVLRADGKGVTGWSCVTQTEADARLIADLATHATEFLAAWREADRLRKLLAAPPEELVKHLGEQALKHMLDRKGIKDILGDLEGAKAERDRMRDRFNASAEMGVAAERTLAEAYEVLRRYVEGFGGIHEPGCPEDDTCSCPFVARTNVVLSGYAAPSGFVLAPLEPDEEMCRAGEQAYWQKSQDMHSPTPTEEPGIGAAGYCYMAMLRKAALSPAPGCGETKA